MRSLYIVNNRAIDQDVDLRDLYVVANRAIDPVMDRRALQIIANKAIDLTIDRRALHIITNAGQNFGILARALAVLTNVTDDDPFPYIDYITPSIGPAGAIVTIYGNGFANTQGTSYVLYEDQLCAVLSWSWTRIVIQLPADITESGYVRVVMDTGTSNPAYYRLVELGDVYADRTTAFVSHKTPASNLIKYLSPLE